MPHLDNVLKSISSLLENEKVLPSIESLGAFGSNMARLVSKRVAPQEERAHDPRTVYASDLGKGCLRQLWYKCNDPEVHGNTIDAATNWRFLQGDIIEETTLFLVEQAGYKVTDRQAVHTEVVDGVTFRGRIDCRIDGILVDVKSMSDFSFKKAVKGVTYPQMGDDPWGYGYQLAFYDRGFISAEAPSFLMINKVTGEMTHRMLDPTYTSTSTLQMRTVAGAIKEPKVDVIRRLELKDADAVGQKLASMCSICPFMYKCWEGQGVRGFAYAEGIRWYGKVNKPARVPEVSFEFHAEGGTIDGFIVS